MNAMGWVLLERIYKILFYQRPVLCSNCAKLVFVEKLIAVARRLCNAPVAVLLSRLY